MQKVEPVFLTENFRSVNSKLIEFLRSLPVEDWQRPTISPKWLVKDVAAHLLDGDLRRIAMLRDNFLLSARIESYQELVNYLNQLNADWVRAYERVSPQLILEMLEISSEKVYHLFKALPPFEKALFPVSWAGEEQSDNWFDIAREYSEKWLHQQQIRDAFGDREILNQEYFYPCLDVFMRGLPHTYQEVNAAPGTTLKISVVEEGGGVWCLVKDADNWQLLTGNSGESQSQVILSTDTAWKLFSKAIKDRKRAEELVEIQGDRELGEKVLDMVSVMA